MKDIDFFTIDIMNELNITSISVLSERIPHKSIQLHQKYIIKSTDVEDFHGTHDETKEYLNKLYNFKNRLDKLNTIIK